VSFSCVCVFCYFIFKFYIHVKSLSRHHHHFFVTNLKPILKYFLLLGSDLFAVSDILTYSLKIYLNSMQNQPFLCFLYTIYLLVFCHTGETVGRNVKFWAKNKLSIPIFKGSCNCTYIIQTKFEFQYIVSTASSIKLQLILYYFEYYVNSPAHSYPYLSCR
jgi:hypothetical protein